MSNESELRPDDLSDVDEAAREMAEQNAAEDEEFRREARLLHLGATDPLWSEHVEARLGIQFRPGQVRASRVGAQMLADATGPDLDEHVDNWLAEEGDRGVLAGELLEELLMTWTLNLFEVIYADFLETGWIVEEAIAGDEVALRFFERSRDDLRATVDVEGNFERDDVYVMTTDFRDEFNLWAASALRAAVVVTRKKRAREEATRLWNRMAPELVPLLAGKGPRLASEWERGGWGMILRMVSAAEAADFWDEELRQHCVYE